MSFVISLRKSDLKWIGIFYVINIRYGVSFVGVTSYPCGVPLLHHLSSRFYFVDRKCFGMCQFGDGEEIESVAHLDFPSCGINSAPIHVADIKHSIQHVYLVLPITQAYYLIIMTSSLQWLLFTKRTIIIRCAQSDQTSPTFFNEDNWRRLNKIDLHYAGIRLVPIKNEKCVCFSRIRL